MDTLDRAAYRTLGTAEWGAEFSADPAMAYRYALWREWAPSNPRTFIVIGLNPSTATHEVNDPTIRRCLGFATREGCGRYIMLNLFAYRATDPAVMKAQSSPVGPENDAAILRWCRGFTAPTVVAAWGVHGTFRNRAMEVRVLLDEAGIPLWCFGRTAAGAPKHPLYLPAATPLVRLS